MQSQQETSVLFCLFMGEEVLFPWPGNPPPVRLLKLCPSGRSPPACGPWAELWLIHWWSSFWWHPPRQPDLADSLTPLLHLRPLSGAQISQLQWLEQGLRNFFLSVKILVCGIQETMQWDLSLHRGQHGTGSIQTYQCASTNIRTYIFSWKIHRGFSLRTKPLARGRT